MIRILQVDFVRNSTDFVIGLGEARCRIGSNALTGIESANSDYSRFQRPRLPGRLKQGLMLALEGSSSQVVDWFGEFAGIDMESECVKEIV